MIWLEVSVRNSFYLGIHEVSDYLRILKIYRTVFSYGRSLNIIALVLENHESERKS